jgi:osmotically-inducible protein OsmY
MDRSRCPVTKVASASLQRSPYVAVKSVSCHYDRGVLVLRGQLPSFYQKQLAQEAVADLEGVSQVVNETEVVAPAFA